MQDYDLDLRELLPYIDPRDLNYGDWLAVGMGLKESGYTVEDWEEWSRRDPARYHSGECAEKWDSFQGCDSPVTGGTIVQMAKENGWHRRSSGESVGYELGWDDELRNERAIVDPGWVEHREIVEPVDWKPEQDLIRYLETLFEPNENVSYVMESWQAEDGSFKPTVGSVGRCAGQIIQELHRCGGDIGSVLGDYNEEAGAWIRFNPVDSEAIAKRRKEKDGKKGVTNDDITDFRYALVESDNMELEKQNALIRELELPVACLVSSGGKSLHAIVRVEAADYKEYRKRVDTLYSILEKNGFSVDRQDKNPSRLSRMPGVTRKGRKQFLIDTNIGKKSWKEWEEWVESMTDDLPDPEDLAGIWDALPELAPPLIDGVLRQGHKMLLAGPSKAGKSFALIELCIAIAEGKKWLEWQCAKGRVLYVNLELDRPSCLHRFRDVYEALGWRPENLHNIDIWNLRGHAAPMDKLAPKLIRRSLKKNYIAIVIDPIYKIITGDENSADQMAAFCNQFDRVCTELGAAVIYCHHHSKGSQGQKRSMDRASGSGVFARDPDAMLDLIELELPESVITEEMDKAEIEALRAALNRYAMHWRDYVSQDDECSPYRMREAAKRLLGDKLYSDVLPAVEAAKRAAQSRTAWRIDGTLREFPKFPPVNLWFDYPAHRVDDTEILGDLEAEGEAPAWQKAVQKHKKTAEKKRRSKQQEFEDAVNDCNAGEPPTVKDLIEYLSTGKDKPIPESTMRGWIKKYGFEIDKNTGTVKQLSENDNDE